jgi:Putative peptidoglycan binding domain
MRRGLVAGGLTVVALVGAAAGFALAGRFAPQQTPDKAALPPATAEITRTTLVETKRVSGSLGYGDPVALKTTVAGTLTWVPPVGSTVARGEPLFKVDEQPVIALYGAVPMFRTLSVGRAPATEGADVRQLQENLDALGYTGTKADGVYSPSTAAAVRRWQTDLGMAATGIVELGRVVFVPGPVRIAELRDHVGDLVGDRSAAVLAYTGITRLVTVQLDIADQALAAQGGKVTVTVPGRQPMAGEISQVATVITSPDDATTEGQGASNPGSTTTSPRIEVVVSLADQSALGSLAGAPVDVDFVSDERKDVLAVPVAALLALPQGGFGLEIVETDASRIVPVKTGVFAGGRVEVTGEGIAEGMRVGVPK